MASGRAFVACRRVSSLFRSRVGEDICRLWTLVRYSVVLAASLLMEAATPHCLEPLSRAQTLSYLFLKTSLCTSFSVKCSPSLLQILSVSPSYHFRWHSGISTTGQQQTEEEDDLYSKILVEVKGHERKVLDSYYWYLKQTAFHLDLGPHDTYVQRKPTFDKLTLNKSVHIFKKHRVQYEARTHVRTFIYYNLTGSTARTFLEYIQRNLPEGVAMKVTKFKMERLPEHLQKDTIVKLKEMNEATYLPPEKAQKKKALTSPELNPKVYSGGIPNRLLSTILTKKQDLPNIAREHAKVTVAGKEHLEVEPAREKHTEIQASEPEHKEIIKSALEHKEVISSEPEHTEVIPSEPEHTEVISSEPEHTEVISSEPEHLEVISSKQKSTGVSDSSVKEAADEKEPSSSDSDSSDSSDDSDDESEDKKDDKSDEGLSDNKGSVSEESKDEKDPNKK